MSLDSNLAYGLSHEWTAESDTSLISEPTTRWLAAVPDPANDLPAEIPMHMRVPPHVEVTDEMRRQLPPGAVGRLGREATGPMLVMGRDGKWTYLGGFSIGTHL